MPEVISRTVYAYAELSPTAKEKAREWFREGDDSTYHEYVFEDAATIGALMGIDLCQKRVSLVGGGHRYDPTIYFSGFWSQGDGACFQSTYSYKKGGTKAVMAHAPGDKELARIASTLQAVQRRHFYQLTAKTSHRGHYYHSGCMTVEVEGGPEDDVKQLLRDFADWIYKQLENAYEHEYSDDSIAQNIEANDYRFDADGGFVA